MSIEISGAASGAAYAYGTGGAKTPHKVQQAEAEPAVRSRPPVMDEYIPGDKSERCTADTDKVDREIEGLRRRKELLERQIDAETDETKIKELERQLAQTERELAQKDNDTYRRQHAVFSDG